MRREQNASGKPMKPRTPSTCLALQRWQREIPGAWPPIETAPGGWESVPEKAWRYGCSSVGTAADKYIAHHHRDLRSANVKCSLASLHGRADRPETRLRILKGQAAGNGHEALHRGGGSSNPAIMHSIRNLGAGTRFRRARHADGHRCTSGRCPHQPPSSSKTSPAGRAASATCPRTRSKRQIEESQVRQSQVRAERRKQSVAPRRLVRRASSQEDEGKLTSAS